MSALEPSREELLQKNDELYSHTDGPAWRLAVYEGLHDGREFLNLGGCAVVELIARRGRITARSDVLELCAGRAAASQYLVERHGCRTTAIDINASQIEAAARRLQHCPARIARRVSLVTSDVLTWGTDVTFDVVFSVDALMLLQELDAVLARAHHHLSPGGRWLSATIAAGPALDDELRQFMWDTDGMITVLSGPEHLSRMAAAGFRETSLIDLTWDAIRASERLGRSLARHRRTIEAACGEAAFRQWIDVGGVYLDAFRMGRLRYVLVEARR